MFLGTLRTSFSLSAKLQPSLSGKLLTLSWKLDEIQLLALLGSRNMGRDEWVHERLEIRSPPLRQRISNLPILIDALTTELSTHGRKPLIQSHLEPFDLLILGLQIVTRELEEGIGNLQHQDMWMIVFVTDQNAFAGTAHAMFGEVFFETLEARKN